MGTVAFFAGLLLFVMGMGKWQETGSPWWLGGSLAFLLLLIVAALTSRGGGSKG
ncbi:hypothetical protein ACFV4F_02900 [Kitasatospora sp. NPDC059722]|uniref:hypothetical protein n=1 Tax=unclassified Kitasatospora TaxID=2633591 RepID=UPI0036691478